MKHGNYPAILSWLLLAVPLARGGDVLTPQAASQRVGDKVTVKFKIGSTGTNPAGFLELYSGQTSQEEGRALLEGLSGKAQADEDG